ncbi:DUF5723 family protein [Salinimicrobium sp. GXAS 041]|uniref:DUF5723 family protein n=1 Tax=Salinimicrobium sp. GXAS 041 TaxID=3400806 RepID=UPI003C71DFD5
MKKLQQAFTVLGLFWCTASFSQSYIGHTLDHYSGIQGITLNPSSVVDSRQRADINLLSVSAFGGSDYLGMDIGSILESEEGFSFDDSMEEFPSDQNQFFLNTDVLGPSFIFNLTPKSSIGIITRARVFLNLNNLNGTLYENISEDFDENENFDFELNNFSGTIHAWGEIGFTYGHILMDNGSNFLKGGVTLKYLQGAGSTFMNTSSAIGQYNASTEVLSSSGAFSYGSSQDFDSGEIDFENLSSGFGGDIGFAYEYRPYSSLDTIAHSDYTVKIGVSVTDIGSISYSESMVTTYDLNNSVDQSEFEDDLQTVLEENYEGVEEELKSTISLPTAFHAFVDYKMQKRLFVSLQGSLSLIGAEKAQANRIINSLVATPRYQARWFSFYLPVGLRQYDGLIMGAGLRLGPLSLGSGSIISNYISDSSKTTDVYLGLKIPIYR